jgi:methionine-rich copper-binding protein CopC
MQLSQVGELVFSTIPPDEIELVSTLPGNGATDVALDADITFTFDGDVSPGPSGYLTVFDAKDDSVVETILVGDTTVVLFDGDTITVDLPTDLTYSTEYFVTLDPDAVQSPDGATFDGFADESVLSFTTLAPPELVLASTGPADDAVDVDPDTPLVFTFSEAVAAGSGTISIVESSGGSVVETVDITDSAIAISDDTVTVDLSATLANASEYFVLIDAGAVRSLLGADFIGITDPAAFSFTTAAAPPLPLTLASTTPANGAVDVAASTNLVLTFSEDVRVGTGNVSIYEADGSLFEVISVTGGQVMSSGPAVTIDPGGTLRGTTVYYVLITAGAFESLAGAAFAGISDPTAFRFTTENTFSLVSLAPADDATGVSVAANLELSFSEPVELGSGAIRVVRTSGSAVLEAITLPDARVTVASNVVTVDLDRLLDASTAYHILVDAGAVQAVGGGDVYQGTSTATQWNFTTGNVTKPGSVAAGLVLWLDADYAASIKTPSAVRFWADRSGQHNDVSNTTSTGDDSCS